MLKCALAIVTVMLVVAVGGLLKLPLLPFRMIRGLFRHNVEPAKLTVG